MSIGRNHPHSIPGAVWRCLAIVLALSTTAGARPGEVLSHQKISDTEGSFNGTLDNLDRFGTSVASMGDLDGDGVGDLAVGAKWDDDGGERRGAVWVLFLDTNGTVKSHQKISDIQGDFAGPLDDNDQFGTSVAALGDLDGDGVVDLAVGAWGDHDGGRYRGAVWVLFLNTDGTVKSYQKISNTQGGFTGALDDDDLFGFSVASLGDLDGDGVADLAVGATGDDDGGPLRGAVWVLFLNTDGTVKSHQKISSTEGGFAGQLDDVDYFGSSVASLGDLDSDGIADLVVGALGDDDGAPNRGAVWVLFLDGPNECTDIMDGTPCTDDGDPCTEDRCEDGVCISEPLTDFPVSGDDLVLVSSFENDSVMRFLQPTGVLQGTLIRRGQGAVDGPSAMAFGPDGYLYVASSNTDSVNRYHWPSGELLDPFVRSRSGGLDGPSAIVFGTDGRLYVASENTDSVLRYDGATGRFAGAFVKRRAGGLDRPMGMVWGPDGNLYVSSFNTDSVLVYEPRFGRPMGSFVAPRAGGLDGPRGLQFGPDGSLYVTSFNSDAVYAYYWPTGASLGSFVSPRDGGLDGPCGLLFTEDAAVYVTSFNTDSVLRYHWPTGWFGGSLVPRGSGGLDGPVAIIFGEPICDPKFIHATSLRTNDPRSR